MAGAADLRLDVRSLALAACLTLTLLGLVPLVLHRLAPASLAVTRWRQAAAFGIGATALFVLRPWMPAALDTVVANTAALTAFALLVEGTGHLIRGPDLLWAVRATAGVMGVLQALSTWVWPSVYARTCWLIAGIALWSAIAVWSLRRERHAGGHFLMTVQAVLCGVALWRLGGLVVEGSTAAIFAPTLERVVDYLGALLLGVAGTVGALLLMAEVALRELRSMAYRDGLTGLANRASLEDAAAREFARARRNATTLGVLLLDVDHFKKVNDRYGHSAGDLALREIGRALRGALRREDEVGRFGGEEFLALLPGAGDREIHIVAERLRVAVEGLQISFQGRPVALTVSIGGSAIRGGDANWEEAIDRADNGLYAAKSEGRNRVVLRLDPTVAAPRRRSALTAAPRVAHGAQGSLDG